MKNHLLFFLFITPYFIVAQTYIGISIGKDFSSYNFRGEELYKGSGKMTVPYMVGLRIEQYLIPKIHLGIEASYYKRNITGYNFELGDLYTVGYKLKTNDYLKSTFRLGLEPFTNWNIGGGFDYYIIPRSRVIAPNKPNATRVNPYQGQEVGGHIRLGYNYRNFLLEISYYKSSMFAIGKLFQYRLEEHPEYGNTTTGFTCTLTYRFKVFNPIRIKNKKKVKCAEF